MQNILDAILAGDTTAEDFAALDLPESYRAVTVHKDEVDMFEGLESRDKDPRKSLHVDDVPLPELGPGEAYVAVMASAINYNTVWTSIFEPVSTFSFLERYGRMSPLAKRHAPFSIFAPSPRRLATTASSVLPLGDRRATPSKSPSPFTPTARSALKRPAPSSAGARCASGRTPRLRRSPARAAGCGR